MSGVGEEEWRVCRGMEGAWRSGKCMQMCN